jgi:hypothetical protein
MPFVMIVFHMSSLKMGLDQAVLSGFEAGSSREGALTKADIERLLKRGAYDIFDEEKNGSAEAESNAFIHQDIDTILQRRTKVVVYENTGSHSSAAGGTFSKARFGVEKGHNNPHQDVDIEDPEFWKKTIGEVAPEEDEKENLPGKRSRTTVSNYYDEEQLDNSDLGSDDGEANAVADDDSFQEGEESSESEDEDEMEGGPLLNKPPVVMEAPAPAASSSG